MKNKISGILLLILALLILSSCSSQGGEEDPSSQTPEEGSPTPAYEEYFESLTLAEEYDQPVLRIPMAGDISDVIDPDTLLISRDHQIFTYQMETQTTALLAAEGWNERISMDKRIIAYENDDGITTLSVEGRNVKLLYARQKDEVIRDYILSRDGKTIYVALLEGDEPKSYLITEEGSVQELPFGESDAFRITQPLYLTRFRLYALAETAQNLQGQEGDLRASSIDFVYMDLATGQVNNITRNAYGDSLEYMDQSSNGNILLRHLRRSTNEDGLVITETFKTFNTTTEFISGSSIVNRNILVFKSIDDERDYITIEKPEVLDPQYPSQVEIRRYTNNTSKRIGSLFTGAPSQIFYHQGMLFFNSNKDTYRIPLQ